MCKISHDFLFILPYSKISAGNWSFVFIENWNNYSLGFEKGCYAYLIKDTGITGEKIITLKIFLIHIISWYGDVVLHV